LKDTYEKQLLLHHMGNLVLNDTIWDSTSTPTTEIIACGTI